MGISLLIFFGQLFDQNGSLGQIAIAHITFCISYVAVTVRARASGMDPQLEEAARDLGASAWGAFRYVTLPLIAPAVAAGAMLPSPCHSTISWSRRSTPASARRPCNLHLQLDQVRRHAQINATRRSSWRSYRWRCSSRGGWAHSGRGSTRLTASPVDRRRPCGRAREDGQSRRVAPAAPPPGPRPARARGGRSGARSPAERIRRRGRVVAVAHRAP